MNVPKPSAENTQHPFLKPDLIGKVNAVATISLTGVARDGGKSEFSDLFVEAKYKGKTYTLGLKYDTPNHVRLVDKFGTNTDKWKGNIRVEVLRHMKKNYLAIMD